jgi:predicted TPR repeat methyltransferase
VVDAADQRFGRGFFERFYHRPATRVAVAKDYRVRAQLLAAHAAVLGIKVRRILDAGAGSGGFARAAGSVFPRARYTGIELSTYACRRYGWTHASITEFSGSRPFDLVICHDVFQYLSRRDALKGFDNLAAMTHGLLYFTALTREDWNDACDRSRTDGDVHLRSFKWYRRELQSAFQQVGPGVYLTRGTRPLFALDALA